MRIDLSFLLSHFPLRVGKKIDRDYRIDSINGLRQSLSKLSIMLHKKPAFTIENLIYY